MKIITIFCITVLFLSSACAEIKNYTASTPADKTVRLFLGISLKDSVDFIRWHLDLKDNQYLLRCNYGIGKPNTNGFINGGKKIELLGTLIKQKNYYLLHNGNKILRLAELNINLLHILDANENFLRGNGGWSYTMNSLKPVVTSHINITAQKTVFKDSIVFEGRTPCGVPGIIPAGQLCYKMKWKLILYNKNKSEAGTYKIYGTPHRKDLGGRTGNWQLIKQKNGNLIYQLDGKKEQGFIFLLKADEQILLFTDTQGNLLVGDEDFSYTLNRIIK